MIPNVPSTLAIFAALVSKSNNVKLQRAITIAMEVSAILAPFIDRPVSWRTISESMYTTLDVLRVEGIISQELTMALGQSVTELNNVNNTIQQINQLSTTDPNYLNTLNTLTDLLRNQSTTLTTNIETYQGIAANNPQRIVNTPTQTQQAMTEFGQYVEQGVSSISSNIAGLTGIFQAAGMVGFDNSVIAQTLQDINRVQNNIQNVINITNNVVGLVNNIQNISRNLLKIKALFNKKRKARKVLPKLPAIIDPKNSQYYSLYSNINNTIRLFNTTITNLSSIPKIPFLS